MSCFLGQFLVPREVSSETQISPRRSRYSSPHLAPRTASRHNRVGLGYFSVLVISQATAHGRRRVLLYCYFVITATIIIIAIIIVIIIIIIVIIICVIIVSTWLTW